MKLIITESQNKNVIKSLIKKTDWETVCQMLGLHAMELAEIVFNNDPMEFLHLFDDLNVSKTEDGKMLSFNNDKGETLMVFYLDDGFAYIDMDYIWRFLRNGFGLMRGDMIHFYQKWFDESFGLEFKKADCAKFERS